MDPHQPHDDPNPITSADLPLVPPPSTADADVPPKETLGGWFKQNWTKLAVMAAIFALICRFLHPLDVLLAGFGLSFIIFLHELGHFLAAKMCDVHVRTFSIGFGPALPFCQFKRGETTYKLAMIPLGGYVAMVGESEEDGEPDTDPDEHDDDPRSFRNKSVPQRMLIISAGVIMNLILGCACFVATYLHGVEEKPSIASYVEPGSAAWQAGIPTGSQITRIDGRDDPWFDDLRPIVSSTTDDESVNVDVVYQGETRSMTLEPTRPEGTLFPVLGIRPLYKLELREMPRDETVPPYLVGSAAAAATSNGGAGFLPGDTLTGMTDPANPHQVTPFDPAPDGLPGPYFDYIRRLTKLAGEPITVEVRRAGESGETATVVVPPAYRKSFGLRMRMGPVTAVRQESAAVGKLLAGDRIVSVVVTEPTGEVVRFAAGQSSADSVENVTVKPLDPLRLPDELNWWSDRWLADRSTSDWSAADRTVKVDVLRQGPDDHTEKRVSFQLAWDERFRYESTEPSTQGAPVPLTGLGVGYLVDQVVDAVEPDSPAANAGLRPNDQFTEIRLTTEDYEGEENTGSWMEVLPHQWGYVDHMVQSFYPHTLEAKLKRDGQPVEVKLTAVPDDSWPVVERGLEFEYDTRTQKADGVVEALEMGVYRTGRMIKSVYQGLYAIVFGRISVKAMSGPITLARASYFIAGKDTWQLLLWLGLISVNLAVVNFLPIPVLDGGHMVFLIYEGIRGKPAPMIVQAIMTYAGLAMVGCLMLFVLGLDLWRIFFA